MCRNHPGHLFGLGGRRFACSRTWISLSFAFTRWRSMMGWRTTSLAGSVRWACMCGLFIYFLLFNGSRHIKLASDKSARLESVAGSAIFFCPVDDALNESARKSYISWLWAALVVFRFSPLLTSSTTFVCLDRSQRDDIPATVLQIWRVQPCLVRSYASVAIFKLRMYS